MASSPRLKSTIDGVDNGVLQPKRARGRFVFKDSAYLSNDDTDELNGR